MSRESFFTSNREMILWSWLAILLVGIYSTMGVAQHLYTYISHNPIFVYSAFLFIAIVFCFLIYQWVLSRPPIWEVVSLLALVLAYLMILLRTISNPMERTHLIEYGVVALIIFFAMSERKKYGKGYKYPVLVAIISGLILGILDELIQSFIPNRVFDPIDILFNSLAVIMVVSISWIGSVAYRRLVARKQEDN